mmetsp:Transcript_13069/g.24037  ORF Transcript_13069/g.24037 Transcript_13069/m.24037 type:complete len:203 (+) Transcript_13069:42-650(+)
MAAASSTDAHWDARDKSDPEADRTQESSRWASLPLARVAAITRHFCTPIPALRSSPPELSALAIISDRVPMEIARHDRLLAAKLLTMLFDQLSVGSVHGQHTLHLRHFSLEGDLLQVVWDGNFAAIVGSDRMQAMANIEEAISTRLCSMQMSLIGKSLAGTGNVHQTWKLVDLQSGSVYGWIAEWLSLFAAIFYMIDRWYDS